MLSTHIHYIKILSYNIISILYTTLTQFLTAVVKSYLHACLLTNILYFRESRIWLLPYRYRYSYSNYVYFIFNINHTRIHVDV